MASLKDTLMQQGLKLLGDPRVAKMMQDPRFMKTVMAAMAMPGKLQSFSNEQIERLAKAMSLATEDEVQDLRRTVRKLEDELSRIKREAPAASTASAGSTGATDKVSKKSSAREGG